MGLLIALAWVALPALALVALPAVAGAGGTRSGIAGRIVEGPTCPVETVPPQPQCAPRPLQASVRITPAAGHGRARTVRSDTDGRFRVSLAPGGYTVRGLPTSKSGLPRPPAPQQVQVKAGRFTHIRLNYDTGIR